MDDERELTLEEVESCFGSLCITLSPQVFLRRCETIDYRVDVALDAIKEFCVRLGRLELKDTPTAWNEFMEGTERMVKTLTKWDVFHKETILSVLENDLRWLVGQSVLDDEDPFKLIKLRL